VLDIQQSGGASTSQVCNLTTEWQRFSVSYTTTGAPTFVRARILPNANTPTVFAWGAQLNVGALQSYNSTTPKNLLGFTQEFDNAAWVKANVTVLAKTIAAPDGTNTASTIVEDVSSSVVHRVRQPITPALSNSAFSVYVKPNGRTQAWIGKSDAAYVLFDLDAVTASTVNWPGVVNQFTPLPNGWFRISVTNADFATTGVYVGTAVGGAISYIGDGTSGIYIWGAQLSNSASVDPYVYNPQAAPTSTAYYGPRFDYDPVTLAANGLLIEEQRTNLLTYSEQFDNAAWTKGNLSITANATTAPDATTTADKLVENTALAEHLVVQSGLGTGSKTVSVYFKAAERTKAYIYFFNATDGVVVSYFDLSSGTVLSGAGVITPVGGGWYRCSLSRTATASDGVYFGPCINSGSTSYTGDGTSGIYIWGAQLEAGAFATSYIPTVASQVTRAADNASMLGDNFATWFNANEGSVSVSASTTAISNNPIVVGYSTTNTSTFVYVTAGGGAGTWNNSSAFQTINVTTNNTIFKSAMAYSAAGRAIVLNGGAVATNANLIGTADIFALGKPGGGTIQMLNGHIRSISYYPTRLPNATLQSITA
jgi:hypothetical protein